MQIIAGGITINVAQLAEDAAIRELKYSVTQANRQVACPGEIVTMSCLAYGTFLTWELQVSQQDSYTNVHTFSPNDVEGMGFSVPKMMIDTNDMNRFNFSGVLDFFIRADNQNTLLPTCQSTMAIIPTSNISNVEFTVVCRSQNIDNPDIKVREKRNIMYVAMDAAACSGGK